MVYPLLVAAGVAVLVHALVAAASPPSPCQPYPIAANTEIGYSFIVGTSAVFELVGLDQREHQLRVSYPATTPASFSFAFTPSLAAACSIDNQSISAASDGDGSDDGAALTPAHRGHHRRILNTAMANVAGGIDAAASTAGRPVYAVVTVRADSVPPMTGPVRANVELAVMVAVGGASIPADVVQLLPGVAAALAVVVLAIVWRAHVYAWLLHVGPKPGEHAR